MHADEAARIAVLLQQPHAVVTVALLAQNKVKQRAEILPDSQPHLGDGLADGLDKVVQFAGCCGRKAAARIAQEQVQAFADVVQASHQFALVDLAAHPVGDGIFQVVRLVHDQIVIGGQSAIFYRRVRDQQRMVGDDDMGGFGLLARAVEGANASHFGRAARRSAAFVLGAQPRPHLPITTAQCDRASVASPAFVQPDQNLRQRAQFIVVGRFAPTQGRQPPRTQVIAAPFHQRRAQLFADHLPGQGNILAQQLLLQVDGVGGDCDSVAILQRPARGRDQISQRFARACARLDQQLPSAIQRFRHLARHVYLLWSHFKAVMLRRQSAVFAEYL